MELVRIARPSTCPRYLSGACGGLVLLVGLFSEGHGIAEEAEWKNIMAVLIAIVPDERREEVISKVEEYAKGQMKLEVWLEAGTKALGRCAVNTLVVVLGFAVHTFLT